MEAQPISEIISKGKGIIEAIASKNTEKELTKRQFESACGHMIEFGYLPYDDESFDKLAKWLAMDKLKMTKRGILLTGEPGTGKTFFLKTFVGKPITSTEIVSMSQNLSASSFRHQVYGEHIDEHIKIKPGGCVVDDLGQERALVSYGNREEVMESVICELYRNWQSGHKSHFSTNLSMKSISKRYGTRVADRLKEMCFIVEMKGDSLRS